MRGNPQIVCMCGVLKNTTGVAGSYFFCERGRTRCAAPTTRNQGLIGQKLESFSPIQKPAVFAKYFGWYSRKVSWMLMLWSVNTPAGNDEKSDKYLIKSFEWVTNVDEKLTNPDLRKSYLENVQEVGTIQRAYKDRFGD